MAADFTHDRVADRRLCALYVAVGKSARRDCAGTAPVRSMRPLRDLVDEEARVGAHESHETHERIHEAGHRNKGVAILITVLAALLAVAEMGGKSAQTESVARNIEAANLWAFFQAKTIRQTTLRTAADALAALGAERAPPDRADALAQQVARWRETAERYETEPSTQEGRNELAARAKAAEAARDTRLAAYHQFEYASAAFQLAIVLASASVITGVLALAAIGGGLGAAGVALSLLAWWDPALLHL
jgi:Domain of unknown function (DUF4337)